MKTVRFLKLAALALLTAGITVACGEIENKKDTESLEQEFLTRLQSVPFQEKSENESFPEWLLSKIEIIESDPATVSNAKIYRGEWEKQIVYLMNHNLNACILCDVYYESGSKILLPDEKACSDFFSKSKNWVMVYRYGTMN
ncbi:MAG: hypothetical protein LBJ17_03895 [Dysgonamonadaceae bacterium]|jgi:hypothetical protein|nr:hypothetical protein [Dysgonamonadaceae bacterium]